MSITQLQRKHHQGGRTSPSFGMLVTTGLAALAAVYFLLPLVWVAIASTKDGNQLYSTPMFGFPNPIHFWENVTQTLTVDNGIFRIWYLNSIFYATTTAVLSTLCSFLCGYALAKYDFKLRNMFSWLVLAALFLPSSALALPTFLVVRDLGLINTYSGVIVPMVMSPFGAYFMRVYIGDAIPDLLLDSARVDGAGEWRMVWTIGFPIVRPGIFTVFLLAFVAAWNNFFLPLLTLNDARLYPVILGMQNFPDTIMGSLLSILPAIVLFSFVSRGIKSGILSGGLKL